MAVKGYKKTNYYSSKKLEEITNSAAVNIDYETGQKLIQNVYVHSGLYNFRKVVKDYQKSTQGIISKLNKKLKNDFQKQIFEAKKREKKIYKATYPEISTPKAMQEYLTYDSISYRFLEELNFYSLLEEALKDYSDTEEITKTKLQQNLSKVFSDQLYNITKEITDNYKDAFDYLGGLNINSYLSAISEEKIAIKKIKNKPSSILNVSAYQGDLGEISAFLDQMIKNTGTTIITTELVKNNKKNNKIKFQGLGEINEKADIGVSKEEVDFGIQVKNYKDPFSSIGIHKTKNPISSIFNVNIISQASKELNLNEIFKDINETPENFEKFIQYCIVNAQTFKSSGVYIYPSHKKKSGSEYKTYDAFKKEVSFIYDYINYLATYWIGIKILDGAKNKRNVAFYYLNGNIIPVSQLLEIILKGIENKEYIVTPKFSGIKIFTPSVLKNKKWKALKTGENNIYVWNKHKEYPEQLLKIGSAIGKESLNSVTFTIEMKLNASKITNKSYR